MVLDVLGGGAPPGGPPPLGGPLLAKGGGMLAGSAGEGLLGSCYETQFYYRHTHLCMEHIYIS